MKYKQMIAAALCVSMLTFAGCSQSTKKENNNKTKTTTEKQTEATTTTEAATTTERKVPDITKNDYSKFSKESKSWWMMRKEDHTQSGADESIDLAKYGAYYVNKDAVKDGNVDKVIYFTFDCGYENGFTIKILDTLKKHNAKGCFFVTKAFIKDNVDLVKRMKEEGHIVGNHTMNHPDLSSLSTKKLYDELSGCEKYMKEKTGYDMDHFMRPPMGKYSERTLKEIQDLGYKAIFWSIAYLDYDVNNQPGKAYVVNHFKKYHHPGAITLTHNVSKSNTEALDDVMTNLEKEGYRFGTLDELK